MKPKDPEPNAMPGEICQAHWDRQGVKIPAFRVGLCYACWSGKDDCEETEYARPLAEAAAKITTPNKYRVN